MYESNKVFNKNNLGKKTLLITTIITIIQCIVGYFVNFNMIILISNIIFSFLLYFKISWAKYLFAVNSGISMFLMFYIFSNLSSFSNLSQMQLGFSFVITIISVIISLILFFNNAVNEFLSK